MTDATDQPAVDGAPGGDGDATRLDPRVARSRAKLIEAATALLVDAGPRGVTVDAVADRSGVAKSTLYRHFASRTELLHAVIECHVPDPSGGADPDDAFDAALRHTVHNVAQSLADPEWRRIMPALLSLKGHMDELAELSQHDEAERRAVIQSILDRGVAEGRLRTGIDVGDAMAFLVGPLLFTALQSDDDHDYARLADRAIDQFLAVNAP